MNPKFPTETCEEAIQLAYGTFVVQLICAFVNNNKMHGGRLFTTSKAGKSANDLSSAGST
jgi:hypothetical protein